MVTLILGIANHERRMYPDAFSTKRGKKTDHRESNHGKGYAEVAGSVRS